MSTRSLDDLLAAVRDLYRRQWLKYLDNVIFHFEQDEAELSLEASSVLFEAKPSPIHQPEALCEMGRRLLEKLPERHKDGPLARQIGDMLGFAQVIDLDARANGVLWAKIKHISDQKDELAHQRDHRAIHSTGPRRAG